MLASPFPAHAVRGCTAGSPHVAVQGKGYPLLKTKKATACPDKKKKTTKSAFDQASCQQKEVIKVDVYITKVGTEEITFCKVSSLDSILLARPESRTRH